MKGRQKPYFEKTVTLGDRIIVRTLASNHIMSTYEEEEEEQDSKVGREQRRGRKRRKVEKYKRKEK